MTVYLGMLNEVCYLDSVSEENAGTAILADTDIRVQHDGAMEWPTLAIIRASCRVQIRDFPFDQQNCSLLFSSWTEDASKFLLLPLADTANLESYVESGEWTLLGMPAVQKFSYHGNDGLPYAEVEYTVMIERKALFIMFNLVLPCLLLMVVGLLTFCVSPDTGEKIPLCTTVLLSMMFFQVLLSESMPPTSDVVPLLSELTAQSGAVEMYSSAEIKTRAASS